MSHQRRRARRDWAKSQLRKAFEIGQRVGVDVLPRHFYSQVPPIRQLRVSDAWREPHTMVAVLGRELEAQLAFLRLTAPPETVAAAADVHGDACQLNGAEGYGPIEAVVLYAFIRTRRPCRIVQVGAGVSTAIVLRAAAEAGYTPAVTCIDPFPTQYVREQAQSGHVTLVHEPAQEVPLELLTDLDEGSLLFVDSTHTVRPGSEVNRIVLEVLPRLREGVFVHFHDITFPFDHSPGILDNDLFFWTESTLVHAFLTGNPRVKILISLSMLHHAAAPALREMIPGYRPETHVNGIATRSASGGHFPSALYLQTLS